MWPFKISGNNNAKMCLRTNALNGKKIGEGFFLKYFILIFIHQTTSTCHNKLTKVWRYNLVFGYNRTLGIILILDSCHVTWSTTYIPNGYPNYSPGQYLSSEQKPLFQ